MPDPGKHLLMSSLAPGRVLLTDAMGKEQVLNTLVDALRETGEVQEIETLREAIFNRESLMSTGIGLGVGVPHARISAVRRMVMSVAVNRSILTDYESIDGGPVRIVFLVAARLDQQSDHVRLLSTISRLVKDTGQRNALLEASTPLEVYNLLTKDD